MIEVPGAFAAAGKKVVGSDPCMGDLIGDLFLRRQLQIVPVQGADTVRSQRPDAGNIFAACQAGCLYRPGMIKDLLSRSSGNDAALMHEQQMVAELIGLVAVVGNQDRESWVTRIERPSYF